MQGQESIEFFKVASISILWFFGTNIAYVLGGRVFKYDPMDDNGSCPFFLYVPFLAFLAVIGAGGMVMLCFVFVKGGYLWMTT